jgi:thiamine biosynthesis lipoprotein
MPKRDVISKLNRNVDRRAFLKACGALGVGAVAGGIVQTKFDVLGLSRGLKKVSHTRVAMGTYVTVTAVHQSSDQAEEAIGRAFEEMERQIAVFNRYDSASPVSVLNRDGQLSGPPPELTSLVSWAQHFNQLSGGAFDVTVKPLIDLFDNTLGRDGGTFPRDDQIADALALVDAGGVEVAKGSVRFKKPGMGVTLDGIAKGHIVDTMSAALAARGVKSHLINAGGDIRTSGSTVDGDLWRIAVEDPHKKRNYPDVIHMADGAVATSGNYEIFYDKEKVFHHVVDPRTGASPHHSTSVTVRTTSVMVADALSTGIFVVEPRAGLALLDSARPAYSAQCLILGADGGRHTSDGWACVRV